MPSTTWKGRKAAALREHQAQLLTQRLKRIDVSLIVPLPELPPGALRTSQSAESFVARYAETYAGAYAKAYSPVLMEAYQRGLVVWLRQEMQAADTAAAYEAARVQA